MRPEVTINGSIVQLYENSLSLQSQMSQKVSTAVVDIEGEEWAEDSSYAIALNVPAYGGYTRVQARDIIEINRGATPYENAAIILSPAMGGNSTYLDKFFAGYVAIVEQRTDGLRKIYHCQCQDYNSRLNSILVDKTYTNMTEAEIIADLFTAYWGEIDATTYVVGATNVASIVFPDIYLMEALEMLADMHDKAFYIDYDKKLHYFTPQTDEAPFQLSDQPSLATLQSYQMTSWVEDAARLKNRVTVKGDTSVPIEVTRQDDASYTKYGEWHDFVHIDRNINTAEWANLVGDAILAESAFENIKGNLRLWQEGLVVGQKVKITDRMRHLDGFYLVRSLLLRMLGGLREEVDIEVGDYSRDLVELLGAIDKLERKD